MALPDVTLLTQDRTEARELADRLAGVLDDVLEAVAHGHADANERGRHAEHVLQEWHERSWRFPDDEDDDT